MWKWFWSGSVQEDIKPERNYCPTDTLFHDSISVHIFTDVEEISNKRQQQE